MYVPLFSYGGLKALLPDEAKKSKLNTANSTATLINKNIASIAGFESGLQNNFLTKFTKFFTKSVSFQSCYAWKCALLRMENVPAASRFNFDAFDAADFDTGDFDTGAFDVADLQRIHYIMDSL